MSNATLRAAVSIPEPLRTEAFETAWNTWLAFHQEIGEALNSLDEHRQLQLLSDLGPDAAVEDITRNIEHHPLFGTTPEERAPARQPQPSGDDMTTKTKTKTKAKKKTPETPTTTKARVAKATKAAPKTDPKPDPKPEPMPSRDIVTKKMSALDAAYKVLVQEGVGMNCDDLIAKMAAKGYWSSPGGKTPAATLYAAIGREIETKKDAARFNKVSKGVFAARAPKLGV